ncbi:MAG: NADPH-dependent FMN reductase [Kineosporiaceae bacterium]
MTSSASPTTGDVPRIGVIVGSTRPGRKGRAVADWVVSSGRGHPAVVAGDVRLDVVDLADAGLPLLDEPVPALFGAYQHPHTRRWSQTVASCHGFVVVTPEYNHSVPGALKNAVDFLYAEWAHKPVGFVGYGLTGAVRAVEHLRLVMTVVKAVPLGSQVALSVFEDVTYADPTDPASPFTLTPREHQTAALAEVLDDIVRMCRALAPLRAPTP